MAELTAYQQWYWQNRNEHNLARRIKYANDPEHREKQVKRARDYRARKKAEKLKA